VTSRAIDVAALAAAAKDALSRPVRVMVVDAKQRDVLRALEAVTAACIVESQLQPSASRRQ
jgi:hypothetical protein